MLTAVAAAATLALTATGCGVTSSGSDPSASGSAASGPLEGLRIMVPNTPGGGYDTTARVAAKVMDDAAIASNLEVFNLAGAGGTVGLARIVNEKGNGDLGMLMGLGVVGASYTNESEAKLTETTPIAKLIEEPGAIMVSKDSPYKTIDDLVAAWKKDPGKLSVGGGSSPGGPDHLLPMQLAEAVGIDPKDVNFVSYDGGGDLLPAILGNKLDFAASGAGEYMQQIEEGSVRVLATSGEERLEGVDSPTLQESDIDLVFSNWRGLVAPPEISDEDKTKWTEAVTKMHESDEWQEALDTNGWTDAFMTGDEFSTFLSEQDERVANVLKTLGLA
ncbi:C4-dicarboxylate ABC transporter substrate-binding protein [Arthrobacter sp. MYb211]|nr:C4-dicarboxylate ABC transporter substrate-binding protein [Glutamicibacter sp. BW80]PQZ96616.1 C4-dicarboxylate ABC transporter substrate-binding protein [Arthrobacter sp. MYb224]PRA02024.1 C4-dicarboxylate ABC transporter substrate-binding protein [Arthrobacter sp. MYb229]PRA13494.1 C4-dicarboxylate ABC transporter substrate-binding protein [Arthrobacter sp. MYb221]PRB50744.1 C4-dicarboxylate ABC transporter substrate-binding protein [Arthrobacter sp. MYb216]PRC10693.1 C4-dicarboxylate AB